MEGWVHAAPVGLAAAAASPSPSWLLRLAWLSLAERAAQVLEQESAWAGEAGAEESEDL